MKTLIIALLFPVLGTAQDTLPAILKIKQGNLHKYVKGCVVLTKDCKVVEYLRMNTWQKEVRLMPFPQKYKVVDYRLFGKPATTL